MAGTLQTACRVALAGALCLVLGACASSPTKSRYRAFVPPPLRGILHETPAPIDITHTGLNDPSVPIPVEARLPGRGLLPSRPSNPQFLIDRADRLFADGRRAVQEGRNRDARRSFDEAIQVLMSEPLPADPVERRRLGERLDDLADAIYHYDVDQLGSGIPEEQAAELPPPVEKQILETNLPVNPGLRDRVREQIETTMSELPLEVTDAVLGYIDYFSTDRGRRVLLSGFARAGRYKDMITRVFSEEGLPEELIFVAQLESHFNPSIVSYARAVGMWQFMKPAGGEYRLTINGTLDERRDPEKATRAAAQFLLDLYRHYGDWYLALAAYNCGAGCVDRAIQRTGYADFWELRRMKALPLATTNYVPEILAMTIMFKNAAAYELNIEPDPTLEYDNVVMDADTSLNLVATAIDRPAGQLKQLNPALLQTIAPKGYALHLPAGSSEPLKAALDVVPHAQRKSARIHLVEESDTPTSVAKKYGTTVAKLTSVNDGALPGTGKFALIPAPAPPAKAPAKAKAKTAPKKTSATAKSAPKPKTSSKPATRAGSKTKAPARPGA
ncbi:MAG: lytic transglycosylase domain-containing protein [Bryobacteraceae bacterium]